LFEAFIQRCFSTDKLTLAHPVVVARLESLEKPRSKTVSTVRGFDPPDCDSRSLDAASGAVEGRSRISAAGWISAFEQVKILEPIESVNSQPTLTNAFLIGVQHAMAEEKLAIKTFEYKLRMNRKFKGACERELEHSRQIYNAALHERIDCYKTTGKGLTYVEQSRHLTQARTLLEVKSHIRSIQQDALERVEAAYLAFFRRVKEGVEKPGFPRFKGRHRYHTFSLKLEAVRGCPIKGDKLTIPGVGSCRVRLSRDFEGKAKQIRITRRADGWYALIVSEIAQPAPLPATGESAGIDVGIKCFATLSTGEEIDNPRCLKNAEKKLKKQQRRLSRKKRGSKGRLKARNKVALAHLKVKRTRKDFHHKASTSIVRRFDAIAVEELNIRGLLKNPKLAKAIADVGWSAFFTMIEVKAGNAGRRFEKVPARYTSQECSGCGHRQKMPLAVRVYQCPSCGLVIDRDHNAALNISGRAGQARINACGESSGSEKQERHRLNRPKGV